MQDKWSDEQILELIREESRPSLFAGNAYYWMVCAAFALLQVGMSPLYWMLSGAFAIDAQGYVTAVQVLFYLGVIFLPVLIYSLLNPGRAEGLRLNPVSPGRALLCVALAGVSFLAANFVTLLWMLLLEALGADPTAGADVLSGNMMLDIFVVAMLPGVFEELMFRGMVLAAYERWGAWKAIWIAALLFTGLHGSLAGIPAELLLGVVLGFVTLSTNSLYAAMMLHTAYNAITLLGGYAAGAANAASGTLMQQLGGPTGVILTAVIASVFVVAVFLLLHALEWMRRRDGRRFGADWLVDRSRLSRSEIVLMASALCTLAWFYVQDAFSMFGGAL